MLVWEEEVSPSTPNTLGGHGNAQQSRAVPPSSKPAPVANLQAVEAAAKSISAWCLDTTL